MSRLAPLDPAVATGRVRELLDALKAQLGGVPNLMRSFAHSPAALEFFMSGSQALAGGVLPGKLREQIDLAVSEVNGCRYCLAAHSFLGKKQGLTERQIADARRGAADEVKVDAIVRFARTLTLNRGQVPETDVARLRKSGVTDAEIAEVIAAVALKIFTNYFAVFAGTDVDFPKAAPLPGQPQPDAA
jgi:uncharacterized peroxidase-related enzyme